MIHMPKGAKVLKDLLSHKEKLKKAASSVKLSEECSAIIQKSLPQKEGDPGSFTLPCLIGPLAAIPTTNINSPIDVHVDVEQRVGDTTAKMDRIWVDLVRKEIKTLLDIIDSVEHQIENDTNVSENENILYDDTNEKVEAGIDIKDSKSLSDEDIEEEDDLEDFIDDADADEDSTDEEDIDDDYIDEEDTNDDF
ncbi:hypothetical protein Tco_0573673 [Tanacetum coccineum]